MATANPKEAIPQMRFLPSRCVQMKLTVPEVLHLLCLSSLRFKNRVGLRPSSINRGGEQVGVELSPIKKMGCPGRET